MKRLYTYAAFALALALTSCNDNYLDRAPEVALPESAVFANPTLAAQFADNAYNFLIDDYARLNTHRGITGQFSDEAVSANNDVAVRTINSGDYQAHAYSGVTNDILTVYVDSYKGIRIVNQVLEHLDQIPFPSAGRDLRKEYRGQMHFLRALYYSELVKRFGGVIIETKAEADPNADISKPKSTFDECVAFILSDLDVADANLPLEYQDSEYGRATKGAAYALRARLLLLAASPLHNPENDRAKWSAAAAAAHRLMVDLNNERTIPYTLTGTDYNQLLNYARSDEYIMIKPRNARSRDGMLVDFVMSPRSGGAQGTLNPSQNHVDLYEMQATGLPISNPASGYTAQNPYAGRDPRFYANILYNDRPWQGWRIDMWSQHPTESDFVEGSVKHTVTGYYCRKFWPEAYKANATNQGFINYIFFRYGEVLLNYAEAQNEALDAPDESVYLAIKQIRDRAGMPELPEGLTKEQMRQRIRNERAVELAFEDIRWYDLLRWRAADVITQPMRAVRVTKNSNGKFAYTYITLPESYQKRHESYMDLYPFPRNEVYKSDGKLIQNPGW
jgi:starch-binding outer membrane protein, SusD/RagB family